MQKTTDQLMNEIQNSHEIEKFLENNNGEFTEEPLCDHLEHLLKEKKLQKSKVVARSGLNRIYGYQILSGKRVPSRDFLNEAAAFSPRAVGSKQAGANEVHRAQNLRWRRKRQDFILLQSAESDTPGISRISEKS